ncbi:glutaredoxin family protein [Sphaerotilus hippei]|uniref:glutaredoxin family protein n=1 Tax=Sphaerotilus hippei TaxID=744406 RepID=UPI0014745E58|nr:glutaredoxin family protein [Sphaerotilus hippei]
MSSWRLALTLAGLVALGALASTGLRHWQDRQLGAGLRAQVRPGELRLISSTDCHHCDRARDWLQRQQVAFSECLIERDAECRREHERTGASGTPVVRVAGQVQLGFDPQRVLQRLERLQRLPP